MIISVKTKAAHPHELSELVAILEEARISVMTQPLVTTERTQAYADGVYDFINNDLAFELHVTPIISDRIYGLSEKYPNITVCSTAT